MGIISKKEMALRSAGQNNLSSSVAPPLKTAAPVRVKPLERKHRDIIKDNMMSQTLAPSKCSKSLTHEELADKFVEAMAHFRTGRKWKSIQRGLSLPDPLMDLYIAFSAEIMSDIDRGGYPDDEELRQLALGANDFYTYLQADPTNAYAPGKVHQTQMHLWKGKHAEPVDEDEEKVISEYTRMKRGMRDYKKGYTSQYSQKTMNRGTMNRGTLQ